MKNKNFLFSLLTVVALYALAFFSPLIAPHDPLEVHLMEQPQAPSHEYFFGTDQLGRDIFSRTLYALRHSLVITTLASLCMLGLGTFFGILGGYFSGVMDWILIGVLDCMLAFPSLLLTLGICATLGPGTSTILISLILTGWAPTARIVRSRVQSIKSMDFVTASSLLGAGHVHIIFRHILPHCASIISVLFVIMLATTILVESSLSFLGFGLSPPSPTLGRLIYEGARFFRIAPWWSFFPGLIIAYAIISLNLLGDSLRKRNAMNHNLKSKP